MHALALILTTLLAADPVGSTPAELAAYMRSELAKWAKVIKLAGIRPE